MIIPFFKYIISEDEKKIHAINFFIFLVVFYIHFNSPKGGVWENHFLDGMKILSFKALNKISYPIWGFSFLAGVFGYYLPVFNFIIYSICLHMIFRVLMNILQSSEITKLSKIVLNGYCFNIIFLPLTILSYSYLSNSSAYLFALLGGLIIYNAFLEDNLNYRVYLVSGICIGVGANIRSEILILGVFIFLSILFFTLINTNKHKFQFCSIIFFITFMMTMVPWMFYTKISTGKILLSATNGAAVSYLGLGYLPNNPWKINPKDHYVNQVANENNINSTWGLDGSEFFKNKFKNAVYNYPFAFINRILIGWKYMLFQGPHFLNMGKIFYSHSKKDFNKIDFINENFKKIAGLSFNLDQLNGYEKSGITFQSISLHLYLVFIFEFFLRLFYLALFLCSFVLSIIYIFKNFLNDYFPSLILSFLFTVLITAGLFQSEPRHTTLLFPMIIIASINLLQNYLVVKS